MVEVVGVWGRFTRQVPGLKRTAFRKERMKSKCLCIPHKKLERSMEVLQINVLETNETLEN